MFDTFTLYPVLDPSVSRSGDFDVDLNAVVNSGISLVQLRCKNVTDERFLQYAWKARESTRLHRVKLIINDRPDIAHLVSADGVHVGHGDGAISEARDLLGPGKLIGGSAEDLDEALRVERDGADYVGCGSIFATGTKKDIGVLGLERLREIRQHITIPVVAIGGITTDNVTEVLDTGVRAVAVISDIFMAPDIDAKVKEYYRKAEHHG